MLAVPRAGGVANRKESDTPRSLRAHCQTHFLTKKSRPSQLRCRHVFVVGTRAPPPAALRNRPVKELSAKMTLEQPTGEMWQKIREELNENPSTRDQDLAHIKEWLKQQPHLPDEWVAAGMEFRCAMNTPYMLPLLRHYPSTHHLVLIFIQVIHAERLNEQRMLTFLRGCKFSLEKCKRKLDMYFTMRAAVPEFFADRDATKPELQEILSIVWIVYMYRVSLMSEQCWLHGSTPNFRSDRRGFNTGTKNGFFETDISVHSTIPTRQRQAPPLPGLTPKGWRVTLMRGLDKDVATPNVADAFKLAFMLGDLRLAEEKEGVGGDVYILDASVETPAHFAKFTPTLVKKFLVCVQEAYPVKLKEVHVINVSPLVDKIVQFVKPFLKEKIRDRIFLHSDINDLYNYVPKDLLPAEYGGNAGPIMDLHKAWVKKLEENKDWFAEQENIKANEALRPGKPTNFDELFGIDGSFRQLFPLRCGDVATASWTLAISRSVAGYPTPPQRDKLPQPVSSLACVCKDVILVTRIHKSHVNFGFDLILQKDIPNHTLNYFLILTADPEQVMETVEDRCRENKNAVLLRSCIESRAQSNRYGDACADWETKEKVI
ncbi:Alpha-tocopherol transfer protein-like [Eumeta japonica]|uniref:Alpha-tocopherol transfer protein-like n=1 Tax=Eumeta variegata TaxID=151549 RepID=A0A4C1SHG3_EUMVA|nr:Alpha-tocopherol transfer protein-like [Eumeta japonica]